MERLCVIDAGIEEERISLAACQLSAGAAHHAHRKLMSFV